MSQMRVLVTDGEARGVVATARGLVSDGFEVVTAASPGRPAAARWSRSVSKSVSVPDPLIDEAGFLATLGRLVSSGAFAALLPGSDAALLSISSGRDRLEPHVRIGLPAHESVQRSLDKTELVRSAARHELDSPPTIVCGNLDEGLEAGGAFGYPVVVKPRSSLIDGPTRRWRSGSLWAVDADELDRALVTFGGAGLVQQPIRGDVVSFAGVFADGRLQAEAVSRYHRTWYPRAGNACYSETIATPPELRLRVVALLKELAFEGLFELELIHAENGAWHAIDLNPRVYGSLALAVAAGANLPAVWCRHLLGAETPALTARPGVYYRWTDADLRHGWWQLRNGNRAAAASVFKPHRGVVHPYVEGADRGPGLARLAELGMVAFQGDRSWRRPVRDTSPALIVGAGPNGLAAAIHLRDAGIEVRCFGEPLESWSRQMPAGMLLRSRRRASNIADPQRSLTIEDYERTEGRNLRPVNLRLEEFIDYGRWFQRRAVPDVDTRKVTGLRRHNHGFRVTLEDGEELPASRVIVAAGLLPFTHRPAPFAKLPRAVCSHAYDHSDLGGFSGHRVAVIGSGQSALECAALLHEAGAEVEVLTRAQSIYWLGDDAEPPAVRPRRGVSISPPPTGVGGRITGWIAAAPDAFRLTPEALHPLISFRCIRPAGSGWLRPRLDEVPISFGCEVIAASEENGGLNLRLSDGSTRGVDHVLLGTGYRTDVRRYPFLAPELAAELELADGYPVLGPGLESSIEGLHFLGAPAAHSFGPIMRFVVGTWYAAPALTRRLTGRRQPPISFSF